MSSSRIFVRGLPPNLSEDQFRKHFASLSKVTDIKLIPRRRIGYVGYKTPEDAAKAVKYFNKSYIRMSRIFVEIARPVRLESHSLHVIENSLTVLSRLVVAVFQSQSQIRRHRMSGQLRGQMLNQPLKALIRIVSAKETWKNIPIQNLSFKSSCKLCTDLRGPEPGRTSIY